MGCELNPSIPYTEFSVIIKKQKEVCGCLSLYFLCPCAHYLLISSHVSFSQIIKKLIERKQAQIRKVYPGLSCFKEGVRQIPIESIPGIRTLIKLLTVSHIYIQLFSTLLVLCIRLILV